MYTLEPSSDLDERFFGRVCPNIYSSEVRFRVLPLYGDEIAR